jgi:lipopolysaccharide transport system ATP-binding protein
MDDVVIRVENLSKRYRLGHRERYYALRDVLSRGISSPFRWLISYFPFPRSFVSRSHGFSDSPPHRSPGSQENDSIWALKDVSFSVKHGEAIGIIGPNGAGKTTLLKILSRITDPTEGEVELKGRVGSLLEVGTGFHPELTGRENIYLNGAILGMSKAEINRKFDEIVAFAEIEKFLDTPVKHYSTGMGTRLAFAIAAHLEPEILLVDEVLSVGDMAFRKKCLGKMQDVSQEGRTVLFVSHEMNAIRGLCKNGIWLDKGRLRMIGEIFDVVRTYEATVLPQNSFWEASVSRSEPRNYVQKYFSSASLSSIHGRPTTTFKMGEIIRLTLGMAGTTPHHDHFCEWFIDSRDQGCRVAWGGTTATRDGDIPGESKEISFCIGPVPLTAGTYSISINMGVGGIALFDYWHDAIIFEIVECNPLETGWQFSTGHAPVYIPYYIER